MKEQILKLRAEGKTYNEIVTELNCSKGIVSYYCGENQLSKNGARQKSNRRNNQVWLEEYKKTLKCEICGENRFWVLDFHHLDPKEKDRPVSRLIRHSSKTKVIAEINKCIILCSNCHRDLHHQEKIKL